MIIAIVGAGDLGGALASTLAARDRVGEIRLIDDSGGPAQGKALDIQQSMPVLAATTRITGGASLDAVEAADVVVLADLVGPPCREWQGEAGLALLRRLAARARTAPIVLAGASQAWLVERSAAELPLPWTRVVGSAPAALLAALRALIGLDTAASPLDVHLDITGLPPQQIVIGWESGTIAGASLTARLDAPARARIAARLPLLWPPGPIALAAAAAGMVEEIALARQRPRPAFVALARGGAGVRRAVMAVVDVSPAGVTRAFLPDLSSQERLALENALQG